MLSLFFLLAGGNADVMAEAGAAILCHEHGDHASWNKACLVTPIIPTSHLWAQNSLCPWE